MSTCVYILITFFSFAQQFCTLYLGTDTKFQPVEGSGSKYCIPPDIFSPMNIFTFIYLFIYCKGNFLKRFYLFILDREEGREKERERHISVCHPLLGTWPATQACALTGNRTSDPLVCRPALNPLSHTSQGYNYYLKNLFSSKQGESR